MECTSNKSNGILHGRTPSIKNLPISEKSKPTDPRDFVLPFPEEPTTAKKPPFKGQKRQVEAHENLSLMKSPKSLKILKSRSKDPTPVSESFTEDENPEEELKDYLETYANERGTQLHKDCEQLKTLKILLFELAFISIVIMLYEVGANDLSLVTSSKRIILNVHPL